MPYEPKLIEPKWQAYWREHAVFAADVDPEKPKFYVLDMFPYPSGAGLHVGHPKGYIATDVLSRYKRMRGFNVLHPMGWDAFGLPAEQYAIETGTHPRETTARNIDNLRRQLQALGVDYDWSREIDTTDPGYVRWTQWIFRKLYERDLAYLAEVPVNWCPALGTVLANEEVIDGKQRARRPPGRADRRCGSGCCGSPPTRTGWSTTSMGSTGPSRSRRCSATGWVAPWGRALSRSELAGDEDETIEVFTTRPDTLFGATYMVLAPEHPLVEKITTPEQRAEVERYVEAAARRSERARIADAKEKSGVFTGAMAAHPVTGAALPIWIADYVLATYGTGAVMAVPGHDQRDYEFAQTFDLPIVEVVSGGDVSEAAFVVGDGVSVASDFLERAADLRRQAAHGRVARRARQGRPHGQLQAPRLAVQPAALLGRAVPGDPPRGRQHCAARRSELPLLLPELDDFKPSGEFEPPLARSRDWLETTDPATGAPALRDTNTMPQWAGSCWYYLRFCDPAQRAGPVVGRGRALLDARGPLRRRRRARGTPPALRALLAQGLLRPRSRAHRRAVPEAPESGDDPRLQLPLLRRQPRGRRRRGSDRLFLFGSSDRRRDRGRDRRRRRSEGALGSRGRRPTRRGRRGRSTPIFRGSYSKKSPRRCRRAAATSSAPTT